MESVTDQTEVETDSILLQLEENAMISQGLTEDERKLVQEQKSYWEQVKLYAYFEKQQYGDWIFEQEKYRTASEKEEEDEEEDEEEE